MEARIPGSRCRGVFCYGILGAAQDFSIGQVAKSQGSFSVTLSLLQSQRILTVKTFSACNSSSLHPPPSVRVTRLCQRRRAEPPTSFCKINFCYKPTSPATEVIPIEKNISFSSLNNSHAPHAPHNCILLYYGIVEFCSTGKILLGDVRLIIGGR